MPAEDAAEAQPEGPLAGLRVIDMTRALAGPFCTLVLAALGADVIKVEDPAGGDIARDNAPYLGPGGLSLARTDPDAMSLAVLNRCRGKRSITLDLKRPGATQVFSDLVRHADIVVENFSSGTADRLGVGYAVARAANPAVIYCSISGFGADTSSGVRAMDTIIQALSGVMLTSGAPGEPPVRVGVPMADVLTPVWAVAGILAALHRRTVRNVGEHVDVSMLGTLTSLVATEDWAAMDQLGQALRTGNTLPRLAPFGIYRCADGWAAIVAPQDKLVTDLFTIMGRRDLLTDPRFAGRDARVRYEGELTRQIELWTGERPTAEVVARLSAAGVPAAPVRTPQEAVADERVITREETLPVLHPTLGDFADLRTSGIPFRLGGARVGFAGPAPRLGEDTAQVLTEVAGYTAGQLAALRAAGIVGEELPVELLPARPARARFSTPAQADTSSARQGPDAHPQCRAQRLDIRGGQRIKHPRFQLVNQNIALGKDGAARRRQANPFDMPVIRVRRADYQPFPFKDLDHFISGLRADERAVRHLGRR